MYQSITMPEFEQLWKKTPVKLVDVREDDEFAHAHVDGAISMPLSGLEDTADQLDKDENCLLYTSPSPRDRQKSRMPSSA
jgi:rhodanese-related sulfurtransferase